MTSLASKTRALPLVVVVYRVPLIVEALTAAFEDFAQVQALRADDPGMQGLLEVLRPDALIVEGAEAPVDRVDRPVLHVDLERQLVRAHIDGEWQVTEIDLSPEAIRNTILRQLLEARS